MSTIIVAAILTGAVAAFCVFLIRIQNKHKREAMKKLLKHFSQLGAQSNLIFSSQEILNDCILGLDGIRRKLLVVTRDEGFYGSFLVDINRMRNCSVKKIYGTIKAGELKKHHLDQYLEKIVLHLELENNPPVEILFYKHFDNSIYETPEMEKKARYWEAMLSQLQIPQKNIA